MPAIVLKASTPAHMYADFAIDLGFLEMLIFKQENITHKIGLILSFSLILIWGARLPVVGSSLLIPGPYSLVLPDSRWANCRAVCQATKQ